ncbi:MAG: glycosyltransferase family 4 protein [Bacteroidales bacterium]|jgi:glycosyltransferase involved in cell wall biosynthesis|nr:glycosyltransferase family 4 protein [Bacteroidales bacterium]
MNRTKILLLHKGYSSFVRADELLLKKHYEVSTYYLNPSKKVISFFYNHLRFVIYMLLHFRKFKLVYSWFGDYHSFHASVLSKLLRLKHIIVVGGNDAVSIPAIQYGVFYKNNLRSKLIKIAYKLADAILCVDVSLVKGRNMYVEGKNKVGLENFIPGISKKCIVIPTGYDANYWNCASQKKSNQVLTVGIVDSENRATLKGFDLIVQLANRLPDVHFIFIGVEKYPGILKAPKKNLTIIDKVNQKTLKKYYCQSKVYVQFSITEGLPNTLCEAMLCECIAAGSNVNGIPTVIRDKEMILETKDAVQAEKIILKALCASQNKGKENRKFIKEYYSEERRGRALLKTIDDIVT